MDTKSILLKKLKRGCGRCDLNGGRYGRVGKTALGLTPRAIHDFNRIREIVEAIERYADAEKPIPLEWVDELKDLLKIC